MRRIRGATRAKAKLTDLERADSFGWSVREGWGEREREREILMELRTEEFAPLEYKQAQAGYNAHSVMSLITRVAKHFLRV